MTAPAFRTGKTTRQMLEAPKNALYVWPNNALGYPKDLARYLGRDDLRICSQERLAVEILERNPRRCVVVDHAAWIRGWLFNELCAHNAACKQEDKP